jgi:hypothetical protein
MTYEIYSSAARGWRASGHSDAVLLTGEYQLMALHCWRTSSGASNDRVDSGVTDYYMASKKAKNARSPGWYGRLLAQRESCSRCNGTFKVENMSVCTACTRLICPQCVPFQTARNGNPLHSCGGEVVG